MGYFAVKRFADGGFDSLDLGFNNTILPGGNIAFQGPVSITARGNLRVASGALSRPIRPSISSRDMSPSASRFDLRSPERHSAAFTQDPPFAVYNFAPTFGSRRRHGQSADLIDIGTLSLQNIGSATFIADGGDIRGNGTLQISGDLTLRRRRSIRPPFRRSTSSPTKRMSPSL